MLTPELIQIERNNLIVALKTNIRNEALLEEAIKFVSGSIKERLLAAPASSAPSKHHCYPGGLLQHINENTMHGLAILTSDLAFAGLAAERLKQASEDLVLVALLHDLHKIGDPFGRLFYEPNMIKASRKKDETQMVQSTAKPYAINDSAYKVAAMLQNDVSASSWELASLAMLDRNLDGIPQGELSLMLVHTVQPSFYAMLNAEVLFSVRYHDGAYQGGAKYNMGGKESPVMLAHHHADMVSSRRARWQSPMENPEES